MSLTQLNQIETFSLNPRPPYNFDANFHKPSHFPSSDNAWETGKGWITMLWQGQPLGLKFVNSGTIDKPSIKVSIYSQKALSRDFLVSLVPEIKWRFNLDTDISGFSEKYKNDAVIGSFIEKWKGMKPVAANSLYETLIIYIVLQNATVRRSVRMLENLFDSFGKKLAYDGKILSSFCEPGIIAASSEQALRDLKLGYRAKFIMKLSEQFAENQINEFALRKRTREEIGEEMLRRARSADPRDREVVQTWDERTPEGDLRHRERRYRLRGLGFWTSKFDVSRARRALALAEELQHLSAILDADNVAAARKLAGRVRRLERDLQSLEDAIRLGQVFLAEEQIAKLGVRGSEWISAPANSSTPPH